MINKRFSFSSVKSMSKILILQLGVPTKDVVNTCWLLPVCTLSGACSHLPCSGISGPPLIQCPVDWTSALGEDDPEQQTLVCEDRGGRLGKHSGYLAAVRISKTEKGRMAWQRNSLQHRRKQACGLHVQQAMDLALHSFLQQYSFPGGDFHVFQNLQEHNGKGPSARL